MILIRRNIAIDKSKAKLWCIQRHFFWAEVCVNPQTVPLKGSIGEQILLAHPTLAGGWDALGSFKFSLRVTGALSVVSLGSVETTGCWVSMCAPHIRPCVQLVFDMVFS